MSGRLAGRVALVTGAAQGIGAAIARRFVAEGAVVVGIDHNDAALATLQNVTPFLADVQDHDALARCVEMSVTAHQRIDILVNNAGISYYAPFTASTLEEWRHTQRVNVEAYMVLAKLVVPVMQRARYGRIINISSTQSVAVQPLVSAYAASKGAINALTRAMAVELAPDGILVNALLPGCIHTPLSIVNGVDETQTDEFQEWYVRRRKIPLARPGESEEVASAALFLASKECSYITGHMLVVDGGLTVTF